MVMMRRRIIIKSCAGCLQRGHQEIHAEPR